MFTTSFTFVTGVLTSTPFWILLFVLAVVCIALRVASAFTRDPASGVKLPLFLAVLNTFSPKDESTKHFLQRVTFLLIVSSVLYLPLNQAVANLRPQPALTPVVHISSTTPGATFTTIPRSSPTIQPATPVLTPQQSPTAVPSATNILYQANWFTGKDGWVEPCTCQSDAAWSVANDELVSSGQTVYGPAASNFSTEQAPYQPGAHNIQDYDVVATIRVISKITNTAENAFGIGVRRYYDAGQNQDQGYGWRVVANAQGDSYIALYLQPATIPKDAHATHNFDPGPIWRTYLIEVRGSAITVSVDGQVIVHTTDSEFAHGGKIEIWEESEQIEVQSFIIYQIV